MIVESLTRASTNYMYTGLLFPIKLPGCLRKDTMTEVELTFEGPFLIYLMPVINEGFRKISIMKGLR